LGALALTRPWTAAAVGLPFGLHGLYLLLRGSNAARRQVVLVGLLALGSGSLLFSWQWAVTGDPLLNPYTLWWSYDKIGFGPGVGRREMGHTLEQALINTADSLQSGYADLFGWGKVSWLFLPVGLWALLRTKGAHRLPGLLVSSVFVSLLLAYLAYWIGSSLFGPRYYFEGMFSLTILSAAGVLSLAGQLPGRYAVPSPTGKKLNLPQSRTALVALLLVCLLATNFLSYLPQRLEGMHGLYGISRQRLEPFLQPETQALAPALVFVDPHESWTEYGALLALQDAFLTTPFIFVYARDARINTQAAALFPERSVYYYYPEEPYRLYRQPRTTQAAP
jgi:hypothetical protein